MYTERDDLIKRVEELESIVRKMVGQLAQAAEATEEQTPKDNPAKKQITILGCPWCGHHPREVQEDSDYWWVQCGEDGDCSAAGPMRHSEEEAVRSWNLMRRTRDFMESFSRHDSDPYSQPVSMWVKLEALMKEWIK